ncbi:hypothetical protein AcW1_003158 [Taiwanofungus camphoratus]|nr:hypothetical protein AcW1_003158 [Antrodia cinnamomea]
MVHAQPDASTNQLQDASGGLVTATLTLDETPGNRLTGRRTYASGGLPRWDPTPPEEEEEEERVHSGALPLTVVAWNAGHRTGTSPRETVVS